MERWPPGNARPDRLHTPLWQKARVRVKFARRAPRHSGVYPWSELSGWPSGTSGG
ncbi:MAG: hypothetical protein AVDCRST_MAG18-4933 [uncultured Thermomicrobiales bacterium]|uniref:Uncharacterized protein n=1 Tax=uncultured Thermomicrobiales bacterium TaxID=1645740 RepID=A0A6N3IPG1_9BACT|nr:MAG: hypothetical protein AVDCRST_MAG18-4933 [uncultured Thermomicrobiales bacterium]